MSKCGQRGAVLTWILLEQVDAVKATDIRDNITVVTVCFKVDPPPPRAVPRNTNSRLKVNKASRSYMHLLKAMEGA